MKDNKLAYGHGMTVLLAALCLHCPRHAFGGEWVDPGFEGLTANIVADGQKESGWDVRKSGRAQILERLAASVVTDPALAKSGARCVELSIPKDTIGFEWVSIGQRVYPAPEKEYIVSLWVRWMDGPDTAPANAGATKKTRSAIVSCWTRHRNGKGEFAGVDEWLFDNKWKQITYRFRATGSADQFSWSYVSLLPNQSPADTRVLLDDFSVRACDEPAETETRTGSISKDADFSGQTGGTLAAPWTFRPVPQNGTNVSCQIVPDDNRHIRLALAKETSNFESAQVYQILELREGVRYRISCKIRWENHTSDVKRPAIVNFGIFHAESHVWYGPVDQLLKLENGWVTYAYDHVPPYSGPWKLYIQMNGWGNFGRQVAISIDDFTCTPVMD